MPFDTVRIHLTYANGGTFTTPTMSRWYADWLMVNEIASGYYKGRRVVAAIILTI